MNNPRLVFVSSLFTSRIFWTQMVGLAALLATISGAHPAWADPTQQAALVGAIDMIITTVLRLVGTNGPVSLSAPLSTPPPQEMDAGVHAVQVAPGGATATVTTLPAGTTTTVAVPLAAAAIVPPAPPIPPVQPHIAATITPAGQPALKPNQPSA